MRVFLAGATGAVGRPLIRQLLAAGHEVTATTRNPAKVDQLQALGAAPVVVDGLDSRAVTSAVARAQPDAIVHQMTALAGKPDLRHFDRWFAKTNELRTQGTQHLLAAARAAGVPKLVAQSYTGWNNERSGGWVKTEADALDADPLPAQRESLTAIRLLEDVVLSAPLEGIVLRYGNFYGPGDSDAMLELIRKRQFPLVGAGRGVWSWIHLDDAATATLAALERGRRGIYNVTDDEPAPVAEWLPFLAQTIGAKPPRRVPTRIGRLAAGDVPVRWMTESRGASNEKAKRELDWRPTFPSWRDGFRDEFAATLSPAKRVVA